MNGRNLDTLKVGYTNEEWDTFIKGKLLLFMTENDIEKIQVDDGVMRKQTDEKYLKMPGFVYF